MTSLDRPTAPWFALGAAAVAGAMFAAVRRPRYSFRDRVVIITGGARGLGLALAREIAAEQPTLVLLARTRRELERAAADLRQRGAAVTFDVCDVRDRAQITRAIARVLREHGRIDVLVNNAGIIQSMPFEHAQIEDFEQSMATHFWAPLHAIRAVLPIMRRQGEGRILNIASIGGRIAVPHLSPYVAGKFALVGLSETLHAELKRHGVTVTTATPGLMRTGSHRNVLVRGRQVREAQWFGLASATPLSSMSAERAAAQIIGALRAGKAQVTPGIQARIGAIANALAPELVAAAMSVVDARLLPGTSPAGDRGALSRRLDLGWLERVMPERAAARLNQPQH